MTPDIIIENNTDEPITWERDQDCDGYYLRDTATGPEDRYQGPGDRANAAR